VEADYNLLLKWNSSLGFMRCAEDNLQLTDSQGGGRKGRSAIDLAVKKAVTYDYIRINKEEAINIELDAEACFNMMVELCQNLACLSHGADPLYIRLHAQTQRAQRYYIKHAYGISEIYNTHSDSNPWYGAGQGTGDACPQWIIQSDNLIRAYKTQVKPWVMIHPNGLPAIEQAIDAFIDDTTLITGGRSTSVKMTITQMAQENLLHWHHLLRASGGRLNPQKCSTLMFHWTYNEEGTATITPPQNTPTQQLVIPDKNNTPHVLNQNNPSEAVRLLRVQIAMDGNYKQELGMFVQQNQRYVQAIQNCSLTQQEAGIIYKQCYLPTVSYPLPATNIPPELLHRHQAKATTAFLAKMGYRRNMPRAVVYAPKAIGGLGFRHLGFEQGVQQTLQLIKHMRANTTNGALFQLAINTYQLHAGLSKPILEDTRPCPWIPARWFNSIRQFLHTTNSQVILDKLWTIQHRRHFDRHLMEEFIQCNLTTRELQLINNVRLYLRVTTLSEISNHSGTHVLQQYMQYPNLETPFQHTYPHVGSTLKWPTQLLPGPQSWKLWKRIVQRVFCYTNSNKLVRPMGSWISDTYDANWQWSWYLCTQSSTLYQWTHNQWDEYIPVSRRQTYTSYSSQATGTRTMLPPKAAPVTPIFTNQGIWIDLPAAVVYTTATTPTHQPLLRIDQRLTTPPTQWDNKLWPNIQVNTRIPDLYQQIMSGRLITIHSDAAMNPNRDSSFAWLIATDKPIWTGEGAVPGPVEDAHTGRSEAYGLLMAMRFLVHYLCHFPMTYHMTRTMVAYCDNSGTVSQIESLLKEKQRLTSSTIMDDYDVYEEIAQATRNLHPLRVQYQHIKGHQDRQTPVHKLTKQAQYNVICDRRAANTLPTLAPYSTN